MFEMMPFGHDRRSGGFYDPFFNLDRLERAFLHATGENGFKTDIRDEGENLVLEADMPGVKKEDICVEVDKNYMTIQAKRTAETESGDRENGYLRRERAWGAYVRRFDISGIKADEISGEYKDGVLKLVMPKKEQTENKSRRLELN